MRKSIKTRHQLNAPIEKVWDHIKTGEKWENWFPLLKGSRIEGTTRYCELGDGDVMEERFLSSDAEKTFIYAIDKQHSFPAKDIIGIIRLETDGDQTKMHWTVEMQPESDEVFPMLKQQISEVYAASALKLQELANNELA